MAYGENPRDGSSELFHSPHVINVPAGSDACSKFHKLRSQFCELFLAFFWKLLSDLTLSLYRQLLLPLLLLQRVLV